MISTHCRNCGEPIATWAGACRYCGAANPDRRILVMAAGAAAALLLAAIVAVVVVAMGGSTPQVPAAATKGSDGDFVWVETAMQQCDEQAAKDTKGLHYLVIPLTDEPRDDAGWRRISINDIGNAILINSTDMLAGLRRKALRISTDEYAFSTRNERTKDILTWKPSTGVRKFVVTDAADIAEFRVQFRSNDAARAINWGAIFVRQPGNCYWVNAILRH